MEKVLIEGKGVVRNYWESSDALIELFRTGEIWFALGWEKVAWNLHDENKDIDYVAAASGPLVWLDVFALPSKSENLDGAYKWINFCLRPDNAAALSNITKYNTASKDAATAKNMDPAVAENFKRVSRPVSWPKCTGSRRSRRGLRKWRVRPSDRVRAAR